MLSVIMPFSMLVVMVITMASLDLLCPTMSDDTIARIVLIEIIGCFGGWIIFLEVLYDPVCDWWDARKNKT